MLQKTHLNKRKTNVGLKIRKYFHSQWEGNDNSPTYCDAILCISSMSRELNL